MVFMVHPVIYFLICIRRICCHGNQLFDRHLSDILNFELVRCIILIYYYFSSQKEIAGVSGQHVCEFYYCCHGNRSLNFNIYVDDVTTEMTPMVIK